MSEESNPVVLSPEKKDRPEVENEKVKETTDLEQPLHSKELLSIDAVDVKTNGVQEDRQTNKPDESSGQLVSESSEISLDAADPSPDQPPGVSDVPPEMKSSENTENIKESTMESSESSEMPSSPKPTTDLTLEKGTEPIELLNKGLEDLKLNAQETPGSASGKKGRKAASTPRARSTPLLTSPPLTRSRSRDLMKIQSTPSSPGRIVDRRNSNTLTGGEVKEARGRQRERKN